MWLAADAYAVRQLAIRGVEDVDLVVVPPADPQLLAVGGDIPHVGTSTVRYRPGRDDRARRWIDDTDRALAVSPCLERVPSTIRDVEKPPVAAGIDAVCADSCRNEANLLERDRIDHAQ